MKIPNLLKSNILNRLSLTAKEIKCRKAARASFSPAFSETVISRPGIFNPSTILSSSSSKMAKLQFEINKEALKCPEYYTKCIEHLQSSNPVEYGFLFDETTGKVIQEGCGTASAVCLNFGIKHTALNLKKAKLVVVHGHPSIKTKTGEMTLPVSLSDFFVLNNTRVQKITALNSKGQYSILERSDNFVELSEKQISRLKNRYISELLWQSPVEKREYINKLMSYLHKNPEAYAFKREIKNQLDALQYQEGADIIIDNFWKKNAESIGLKYTSNFKF